MAYTSEDVDTTLDLSRMHVELGDVQLASRSILGSLFALCYLTNRAPQEVAEELFKGLPSQDEWEDDILPRILDDKPLTGEEW